MGTAICDGHRLLGEVSCNLVKYFIRHLQFYFPLIHVIITKSNFSCFLLNEIHSFAIGTIIYFRFKMFFFSSTLKI